MEFVFAFVLVAVAVLGLGVGVLLTGRPLKGSCGGLACVGGGRCDGCPRNTTDNGEEIDG